MVTEVQAKMYFPGYHSMKDISNSAAGYGGWSLPHENNPLKTAQHYGLFLSSAPITDALDYNAYEKEKLRQTIIKHESIFRHQVHELHRLYGKQRDLMREIQSKDDKRSWCASSFPAVGSVAYGRPSSSSADAARPPQNGSRFLSESKRPQRRLFDLEAPAEDDEADVEGGFTKSNGLLSDLRPDSCPRRACELADLNEPLEVDEASPALGSDRNLGNEQSQIQTHVYANIWSAAKQLSENKNAAIGNLRLNNESSEKNCLPFSVEAGNFQKPGESTRVEANTMVKVTVKRKIFGVEVAEGNDDVSSFASKAINVVAESEEPSSTLSWAKPETALPWLRAAPKEERERAAQSPIQDSSSTTCVHEAENKRAEPSECPSVKKILGFPIFDLGSVEESPCVRHQVIDLNECVVEEEAQFADTLPSKPTTGIDLEAPAGVETDSDGEDNKPLVVDDAAAAAEALVSIACSRPRSLDDDRSLSLLADVMISLRDDMDEFERVVLDLPEVAREEIRRAAPAGPEGPPGPARRAPRRGQGRRGRQRGRDFQSEVLPGMASLSRNEVTEDLQAFEGLVRAAGGTWQSSLAPRNGGGGRGRRRSGVAYAAPAEEEQGKLWCGGGGGEAGIEETASLAGWGKRTRRPPRQRCPITNSLLPLK